MAFSGVLVALTTIGSLESAADVPGYPKWTSHAVGAIPTLYPYLVEGGWLQRDGPGEALAIVNVPSGRMKRIRGDWRFELLLAIDDSRREFTAVSGTRDNVQIRTITYDGDVTSTKVLPGLAGWRVPDLAGFALSPDGETVVYNDREDECIYTFEFTTGERKAVMENVRFTLTKMYWVQPGRIVIVIWNDGSQSSSLANSIVAFDLTKRQIEWSYHGENLSPGNLPGGAHFGLSPDRTSLLFAENTREGFFDPALQLMDLQTGEVHVLAPPEEGVSFENLCWSTDSERYAYVRYAQKEPPKLTAEEEREYERLVHKETLSSFQFNRVEKLSAIRYGPRYETEMGICIHSIADDHTTCINDFPKGMYAYSLAFLDETRMVMETEYTLEEKVRPALQTVDIATGTTSTLVKGHNIAGDAVPIAGGSKVICLVETH